ncbi:hypothetical protein 8G_00055 [Ralstonia phage Hyacinthe]|uniref:Uncharacterized protein n=3 Tax=Rahariannevirus raharianne TaxID=2846050 RepID=A0A7G5BBH0_9CAUD|nr:hypothetical protein KMC43_gp74 [Ralstonia phage Raharianne]QMV32449.1 hypothetical protein U2_00074 [Ralstonia phage Albius]QMV33487.1 hypothetical protein 8G_00055 [Ralstonia phage Hyacinthe]QMV33643.1 hypothetical protein Y2_00074 [Ralstonia phage Raharianne]
MSIGPAMRIDLNQNQACDDLWDIYVDGKRHDSYIGMTMDEAADAINTLATFATRQAGMASIDLRYSDGSVMTKRIERLQ